MNRLLVLMIVGALVGAACAESGDGPTGGLGEDAAVAGDANAGDVPAGDDARGGDGLDDAATDRSDGSDAGDVPETDARDGAFDQVAGLGQPCRAAADCPTGHCVDGVCCSEACTAPCHSCAVPGSAGTCRQVQTGDDSDTCTGPNTCSATGGCRLKDGQACVEAARCASGFCVDGVCCGARCTEPCRVCNSAGALGVCSVVRGAEDDRCMGQSTCSAEGACGLKPGNACSTGGDCASGFCADQVCCDTACTDTCRACNLPTMLGSCTAVLGADDPDTCNGDVTCGPTGSCQGDLGQACTGTGECASGNCVDGVCCDADCREACKACNQAGAVGRCVSVKDREDPDTCHGSVMCNFLGQCLRKQGLSCGADSDCASHVCWDGVCCETTCHTACRACNLPGQEGHCRPVTDRDDPDTCRDLDTCDARGACKRRLGTGCSNGDQCVSGFCADGLCCNSACTQTCAVCNRWQFEGSCIPVTNADDPDTCGEGQSCDPWGNCRRSLGQPCTDGPECVSSICRDVCCDKPCAGVCERCDGPNSGSCTAVVNAPDPDTCAGSMTCDINGVCRLILGRPCGGRGDCASGVCKDGVCCDGECTRTCTACNQADRVGTCSPVKNADDPDTCGNGLSCNADALCRGELGTPCAGAGDCISGFCTDGVCCQAACAGTCQTCVGPGQAGQCVAVRSAPDDTCTGAVSCNADGVCRTADTFPCGADGECASGRCSVFYQDADGDTWGDPWAPMRVCGTAVPGGHVGREGDCCDASADVRPDQTSFFDHPSGPCGDTWDYDCSGTVDLSSDVIAPTCFILTVCEGGGWVNVVPGCGETGATRGCQCCDPGCAACCAVNTGEGQQFCR